ncbi:FAD-dependent monooxygenase [Roseomonas gilardii]|uniref:FAD-dependent monooxygenase n=1 Tax=Roseomonas gilardii TaxID=257708 RepID=UPI0024A944C3|nr:FAD-dependent monooxygenase [Roseomonas gilardii]
MWVLCNRDPVRHWSRGRATLIGDAAHPMLQYLAQGACMALEDAVVLAEAMNTNADVPTAFRVYEDTRYLRAGRCQMTARLYGEFFHADGVKRELRNNCYRAGLRRRATRAWLGSMIASELPGAPRGEERRRQAMSCHA